MSVLCGCAPLYDYYGGNFKGPPEEMDANISAGAKQMIRQALSGMDTAIIDHHIHIVARGTMTGCDAYISPDLYTWWKPYRMIKTRVLMSASGVTDYARLDEQYADRLLDLLLHFQSVQSNLDYVARPVQSKFYIYAIDYYYDEDRQRNLKRTDMYVSDDCVIRLAEKFNRVLEANSDKAMTKVIPVASVHPYRKDFEVKVRELAKRGVKFMKWLPPSMNIGLKLVRKIHYEALAKAGITLLIHTGDEHAFRVYDDNNRLGDPAMLRYPLNRGVTVVALHVGRKGKHPTDGDSYFDRFMEIMQEQRHKGRLFGEISAAMINHPLHFHDQSQNVISKIIEHVQPAGMLSGRIRNGSDYPLVATSLLNPTASLVREKLISQEQKKQLDEIYSYNPLLFNFVTKRSIALPASEDRLTQEVFQAIKFHLRINSTLAPEEKGNSAAGDMHLPAAPCSGVL